MTDKKAEPPHSMLDTILESFVPIHQDGQKFIAIGAVLTLLSFVLWQPFGWLMAIVTVWIAYFFRDPPRVTPLRDGLVISPADGKICAIETVRPPAEMGLGEADRVRVSIFLNVFDVHINRAPVAGTIKKSLYVPGKFLNAALDKASEDNERRSYIITTSSGDDIACVQIAGFVARRIVTFVTEGQAIGMGQRIGLIRFGSRADVYLPPGKTALVSIGQRAVGGETVLADLKSAEPEREARVV